MGRSLGGRPLDLTKPHTAPVWGLAFQPDSKMLASASSGEKGTVQTHDTTNGKLEAGRSAASPSFEPDDDRLGLSFSADGKQLAVGAADAVRLFNPETLVQVRKLSANGSGLTAFTPDGKEVLVTNHHYPQERAIQTLERWDAVTGQKRATLELPTKGRWAHPALSPDGKTMALIVGGDTVVHLFDTTTGKPRSDVGHTQAVLGAAFSPDGKWLASSGDDHTIRIWDLASLQQVRVLTRHTESVNFVAFSPDGTLLASCSQDQTVRLWRVPSWEVAGTLMDGACVIVALAFSPDGKLLAGAGDDKTAHVWDVARREEVRVLGGFRERVESVAFGPDGKFAAGSEDATVRLWDGFGTRAIHTLRTPSRVMSVGFTPGGDLLTGGGDGGIRRWSAAAGDLRQTLAPRRMGSPDWPCGRTACWPPPETRGRGACGIRGSARPGERASACFPLATG